MFEAPYIVTLNIRRYIRFVFGSFDRSHANFVSSAALVTVFPMISAPIVARLYTPHAFGIYAVFFSLATILSVISTLELRNVTFLEDTREGGAHGALLALFTVLLISLTILAAAIAIPKSLLVGLLGPDLVPFLIWLPFTVLLMGVGLVLNAWATREGEFNALARINMALGLSTMLLQIGIGSFSPGPIGLILSNLLGLLLAATLLTALFVGTLRTLHFTFSLQSSLAQFRKHYRLTAWMMPATLVNSLSQFLPDLLINRFFGTALLGQYSLAIRTLNMPISLFSRSLQGFFQQQASEEFNKYGNCFSSFRRFLVITIAVSLLFIFPVILATPHIFPIIFGKQWVEAGALAQAVAFLTIARFISSPLSYVWIIRERQRLNFLWQIGLLSISLCALVLPPVLFKNVTLYVTLWIFSMAVGAWYIVAICVSYALSSHTRRTETN